MSLAGKAPAGSSRLTGPSEHLPKDLDPKYTVLLSGDFLWRVYERKLYTEPVPHIAGADTFRYYGPLARFDHHAPVGVCEGPDPERGIYYAGEDRWNCAVEVFFAQKTIKIRGYYMADLAVREDILLLDLRDESEGAVKIGATAEISKCDHGISQEWARFIHAHPLDFCQSGLSVQGLMYNNAHIGGVSVALFERAAGTLEVINDDPLSLPPLRSALDMLSKRIPGLYVET